MSYLSGRGLYSILIAVAVVLLITGCGGAPAITDASLPTTLAAEEASASRDGATVQPEPIKATTRPAQETKDAREKSDLAALETFRGVQAGFTEEGYPYLGDPSAPVILQEYSDFLCPFCWRHFDQTAPTLVEQYVKVGRLQYVFRDMPLAALHPTAAAGHAAAKCAAEQGAAYFWAMHEELFTRQNEWSQLPDPGSFLAGVAEGTGVDMAAYEGCLAAGEVAGEVQESVAAGQALGFNGTPSFQFVVNETGDSYTLIGAYPLNEFVSRLDTLLAGEALAEPTAPEPPEPAALPFWANDEGLAPDPERPGFTLAGDPYKGDPEARLVVVEFSDFQCPACQEHVLEVQPVLDQEFVDSGEILWVFKNLPLKEHAHAPAAAAAAECAGEQGMFWEMHHLLYERLDEWSSGDADAALLALADGLDLDAAAFAACFNGRQALERVLDDLYDAQGVVSTTPNFVILSGGRGTLMQSSMPAEQFVTSLESRLETANAAESESSQP